MSWTLVWAVDLIVSHSILTCQFQLAISSIEGLPGCDRSRATVTIKTDCRPCLVPRMTASRESTARFADAHGGAPQVSFGKKLASMKRAASVPCWLLSSANVPAAASCPLSSR
jgi:hypothetical protein